MIVCKTYRTSMIASGLHELANLASRRSRHGMRDGPRPGQVSNGSNRGGQQTWILVRGFLYRLATHSAAPGVPGGSQSFRRRAAVCRAHSSESAGGGPGAVTAAVVTARPRNNSRQPGRGGPPGAGRVAGD